MATLVASARSAPSGSSRRSPRSARASSRSTPRSSCATRAMGRRRSSVTTTATTSTSSTSESAFREEHSAFAAGDWGAGADRRLGRAHGARWPRPSSAPDIDRPPPLRSSSPARCGARSPSRARTRCRQRARSASERSASSPPSLSQAPRRAPDLHRIAHAPRQGRRRSTPARAQPARRRPAALRLRLLKLRLARARLAPSEATADLLDDASRELDTALQELREIARGLHPAILGDLGLRRARRARGALHDPGGHRCRERAAPRARRDGVLHRVRGADQRRQARGGQPRPGLRPPRRRDPAL